MEKAEGEEMDFRKPSVPTLCANNCGFFGSSATNNLCSRCHADAVLRVAEAPVVAAEEVVRAEEGVRRDERSDFSDSASSGTKKGANRCSLCKKRVGLMGFACRCGDVFCTLHRYADKHGCSYDYMGKERDALAKANPVVKGKKIEKI